MCPSQYKVVFYFTCEHRKIISPLVAVVTHENKFSMITYEIKII